MSQAGLHRKYDDSSQMDLSLDFLHLRWTSFLGQVNSHRIEYVKLKALSLHARSSTDRPMASGKHSGHLVIHFIYNWSKILKLKKFIEWCITGVN